MSYFFPSSSFPSLPSPTIHNHPLTSRLTVSYKARAANAAAAKTAAPALSELPAFVGMTATAPVPDGALLAVVAAEAGEAVAEPPAAVGVAAEVPVPAAAVAELPAVARTQICLVILRVSTLQLALFLFPRLEKEESRA
jgi:hypothetical protein